MEKINAFLELLPLRAMTAAAAIILVVAVILSGEHGRTPNVLKVAKVDAPFSHPSLQPSNTIPIPVEFASTHPFTSPGQMYDFHYDGILSAQSAPAYLDTPNKFLMAIIKNDPAFKSYQLLPHPRGIGVLINSPDYLYEVVIDPAEFPVIQTFLEQQGGKLPSTLREARATYPIYVRVLPSPTSPLEPEEK